MKSEEIKNIVKESYSKIAKNESSCCTCSCKKNEQEKIAKMIGYSNEELKTPGNLGLGCGNPIAISKIKEGDVVLDLGSGAGFDCFLASKKVGKLGKVIGVDMTPEMIERAKSNAKKHSFSNVEFKLGHIEDLPIEDETIDIIISNCVINLSPDKLKVFKEAYRVLKKQGKMYVSDIVLLGDLTNEQKNNPDLIAGCVAGAVKKDDYLSLIKKAGFKHNILNEDKEISKKQYQGINLESIKIEAIKNQ
ncbi:arsenite methyltransferase [Candidatus Woesearchaeota archaeon]|nr:arsenite methyltransferase [Candidatus Woesearchaeota archaeon]